MWWRSRIEAPSLPSKPGAKTTRSVAFSGSRILTETVQLAVRQRRLRTAHVDAVPAGLSARLAAVVDALPLRPDSRVLEIGCGPGAAARAVAARLVTGHILGIDRSGSAIAQAKAAAADEIAAGRMSVRHLAIEDFVLEAGEEPYDLVFAVRVGALDGSSPASRRTGPAPHRYGNHR
jgi:SAM-dependent methyltransferase